MLRYLPHLRENESNADKMHQSKAIRRGVWAEYNSWIAQIDIRHRNIAKCYTVAMSTLDIEKDIMGYQENVTERMYEMTCILALYGPLI